MQEQIIWISKKYKSTKLTKKSATLNDFIDVFEDKINGWYLNWAYSLDKKSHSGFAEMQLALPYFEAIYIFKEGKNPDERGKSGERFKNGFKQVFMGELAHIPSDELEDFLKLLYEEARCGFFHIGMSRPMIALADGTHAVRIEVDANGNIIKLKIDRHLFLEQIKKDFQSYIDNLRNIDTRYTKLRKNFAEVWNKTNLIIIQQKILNTL